MTNSIEEMYLKAVERHEENRKKAGIGLPERNKPKNEHCKKCGKKTVTSEIWGTFNLSTLTMTKVKRGPRPKLGVAFFHREKGLYGEYQCGEYAYSLCFKCSKIYWNNKSRYVEDQEKLEVEMESKPAEDMR